MKNKKKPNTRINKNKDLKIETHNKTTKLSEIRSKDTDESVNKIKKTRTNKKKAVFIVLLILIIFYALFLVAKLVKNPTDTFVVTKGKLTQEETVLGYIAREETVVKGANYKNGMVKIKDEGAKVANESFKNLSSDTDKTLKYYNRISIQYTDGTVFTAHKFIKSGLTKGAYEYIAGRKDNAGNPVLSECTPIRTC